MSVANVGSRSETVGGSNSMSAHTSGSNSREKQRMLKLSGPLVLFNAFTQGVMLCMFNRDTLYVKMFKYRFCPESCFRSCFRFSYCDINICVLTFIVLEQKK